MKPKDIDRWHRLENHKKITDVQRRPITVKYVRYSARYIIRSNQKFLKEEGEV